MRLGPGKGSNLMSPFFQLGNDLFADAVLCCKTSQSPESFSAVGIGIEGALVVSRTETRCPYRILRHHTKLNKVKQAHQCRLVLQVPAGHTNRDNRLAVLENQGRRQGDSWSLAGLYPVGMIRRRVKRAKPVAVCGPGLRTIEYGGLPLGVAATIFPQRSAATQVVVPPSPGK